MIIYNLVLLMLFSPKFLIDYLFKKKYRQSLSFRLFPRPPKTGDKEVIWLHGVSMGETKALATLIPHIRKHLPNAFIFVTTVTETGQKQAKTIPDIDTCAYLPLDFSWVIRPFVRAIRPKLLILVEGDYWLNLLSEVKKCSGKIAVVNGKLSEKSLKRYLAFSSFSRSLFSSIDHFYLQGESYLERFLKLGISPEKLTVTGNLKYDIPSAPIKEIDAFKKEWDLGLKDRIITIGSTHEGEEILLLNTLLPFLSKDPHLKILIVPRHPERFKKVKASIHHPQVIVVDQMGVLPKCYYLSYLAIVGGSFVKGIGGHDIFEPVKMGVPTLFGPYMHAQADLDHALSSVAAAIKTPAQKLSPLIGKLLIDQKFHIEVSEKGKNFAQKSAGTSFRTWNFIHQHFLLEKKS